MFTTMLSRNSWLIYKVGMPLVYLYHLLVGSVFFNTAADDAQGVEHLANFALVPMQYLLDGKRAIPVVDGQGKISYEIEQRFDYDHHFYLKTAMATTALPISVVLGTALKGLSYLSGETRCRAEKIGASVYSTDPHSYYRSIGLQINNFRQAEQIHSPKYQRRPLQPHPLQADIEALKEIVALLSEHNIPFWIDRGSCLGCYQHEGTVPADWDIDLAVLQPDFHLVKNALKKLDPEKYAVQDWSGRQRPQSYLKVYVRESGGLIDIFHFAIDEEKKEIYTLFSNELNIFAPASWMTREKRYTPSMPFSYVFPLKKGCYEGIEVPVPGQIEEYLHVFYGKNLSPAKIYNELTGKYDKDLTHPYWQLPSTY